MSDDEQAYAERRREAVEFQVQQQARNQARETEQARALIERFVQDAQAAGLPTQELKAVDADGRRYRTGVQGWLLRRNGTSGIGHDGSFYLLGFAGGTGARLSALVRGAPLHASDPPLVMGRGGRDGESIPLADLLAQRLEGGDGW